MANYTIVTDSSCDLPEALARELQLKVVPLSLMMEGKHYLNPAGARGIANRALYDRLRAGAMAKTSAANSEDFYALFEPELEAGRDVLYIGFSSALSATFSVGANVAGEMMEKYPGRKVYAVDSLCASLGQGLAWGADPGYLRGFVGNAGVGFKMAMAGRNTAIYSTLLVAGLAFAVVRKRVRPLPVPAFVLLVLPMVVDGFSHVTSEVTGLAFRDSNAWLAALTGNALPAAFYAGTTLGSFNWLMRAVQGALFAGACVWFAFPRVEHAFRDALHSANKTRTRVQPRPVPGSWNPNTLGDTERR